MKLGNNERATRETGQASGAAAPAGTPLERVRALAPAIAAAAEEGERLRRLPDSLMAALHDAGLFRLLIPRRFGGEELDPVSFIKVIGAVGAIDASTAWCLCQNAVCGLTAGYLTPEVATKIFGDRRAVLAWGPGPQARAVPVEGGYRISGTWSFASGGRHATWLGAYCPLYQADGTPLHDIGGALLGRTMLFPASEARMVDIWNVIGLRATGSDGYTLENHFVPSAHSFQRDDPAERVEKGPLYLFPTNTMFAGGFACLALGIAGAVLDAFLALAREKTPRGFKHRLAENGTVQGRIAQALGQLRSSRVYILDCFEEAWREARETGALSLERRMAVRLASTHSIQQAKAVVDTAYDLAGATAIFTSSPFERRFRDMHTVAQQVQGRFSHFETVGKFMLGLEPELAFL